MRMRPELHEDLADIGHQGRKLYPFFPKPHGSRRRLALKVIASRPWNSVQPTHRSPVNPRRQPFFSSDTGPIGSNARALDCGWVHRRRRHGPKSTRSRVANARSIGGYTNSPLQKPSGWPCHVFAIRNTGRLEKKALAEALMRRYLRRMFTSRLSPPGPELEERNA
jgi:hypothetical protein